MTPLAILSLLSFHFMFHTTYICLVPTVSMTTVYAKDEMIHEKSVLCFCGIYSLMREIEINKIIK